MARKGDTVKKALTERQNWFRSVIATLAFLKEALLDCLHDPLIGNLSKNSADVYTLLINFRNKYETHLKSISYNQWDSLVHVCSNRCPNPCGQDIKFIETKSFDISSICTIIRNMNNIVGGTVCTGGIITLTKFKECAQKCLDLRNQLMHDKLKVESPDELEQVWKHIEKMLRDMNYKNMKEFYELKSCLIDTSVERLIEDFIRTYIASPKDLQELHRMCETCFGLNSKSLIPVFIDYFDNSKGEHRDIVSRHPKDYYLFCHNNGRASNVHHAEPTGSTYCDQNITLKIYAGAGSIHERMSMEEFDHRAKDYDDYVIRDHGETEIYPPDYAIKDILSNDANQICKNIENTLSDVDACEKSSIIRFYCPVYHYHLLTGKSARVKVECFNKNNILVICPDLSLLLLFKITTKDHLQESLEKADNDMFFMTQLFDQQLNGSHLTLSCMLACSDLTRADLELPDYAYINTDYKKFIITKEEMGNENLFTNLWRETFMNQLEIIGNFTEHHESQCLSTIHCHMKAIMATTEIQLPSFANNIESKLSTILLQKKQWEAIVSEALFKIIFGSFGTGKTLIAQILLRLLSAEANSVVYYVLCDSRSILLVDMEIYVTNVGLEEKVVCTNLYSICRKMKIKDCVDLISLIEKIKKLEHGKKVHFVLDESDQEWLTFERARQMHKLTTSVKEGDGAVVLLMQNATKERNLIKEEVSTPYEINAFESTGFQTFNLTTTLRSVNSINNLCRNAELVITNSAPTSIYHPDVFEKDTKQQNGDSIQDDKEESGAENHNEENSNSAKAAKFSPPSTSQVDKEESGAETHNEEDSNSAKAVEFSPPITGQGEKEESIFDDIIETEDETRPKMPTNLESLSESLGKMQQGTWTQRTESRIRFNETENGIRIDGQKPKMFLVKCEDDVTKTHSVMETLLTTELKQLRRKRCVIICQNPKIAAMVKKVMRRINKIAYTEHLGTGPLSVEQLREIHQRFGKTKILVTTLDGFRGNEVENVIAIVDTGDEHQKHFTSEIMSRATVNLKIILLEDCQPRDIAGGLVSIVTSWDSGHLADGFEVKLMEDGTVVVGDQSYGNIFDRKNGVHDGRDDRENEGENYEEVDQETVLRAFHETYGKKLQETQFHEVTYQGRKFSFDEIFIMVKEDKPTFESILSGQPQIINNLRNKDQWTLLMKTIPDNDTETFTYLVQFPQQDFSCVSKSIRNVFHHAAWNSDEVAYNFAIQVVNQLRDDQELLKTLLNKKDKIDWIPIHNAARRNNHRTVELYLKHGANPDSENKHHLRPDDQVGVDPEIKKIFKQFRNQ